jgi:hypothetical protein
LNNTVLSENIAIQSYGGALYVMGGTVILSECQITRDHAKGPL